MTLLTYSPNTDTLDVDFRGAYAPPEAYATKKEAAKVAATTARVVVSGTYDLARDRTSFQTGGFGPQSPHTSDGAVRAYKQMIDEIGAA